jgi:hypothetical protein
VHFLDGRLDILATRGALRWLIEVKRDIGFHAIAEAVDQLLLYAAGDYAGEDEDVERRLIVCVPRLPAEEYRWYLRKLDVEVVTPHFMCEYAFNRSPTMSQEARLGGTQW